MDPPVPANLDSWQTGSRKNAIEIELNESLRRRREELRGKIDALGVAETGDATSEEALETRTRELRHLDAEINTLTKRSQGPIQPCFLLQSD